MVPITRNGENKRGKNRAIFLDRDGVINKEMPNYLRSVREFEFLPGAVEAMKMLAKTDFKLIVVTNQAGIAKGYYTEDELRKIHEHMVSELKRHGVEIHGTYYCPHHPTKGTIPRYTIVCECRKPGTKLFREAADEFDIDMSRSWVVGDRWETDIMVGKNLGCRTILVKSGIENEEYYKRREAEPDYLVDNLLLATNIIMEHDTIMKHEDSGKEMSGEGC